MMYNLAEKIGEKDIEQVMSRLNRLNRESFKIRQITTDDMSRFYRRGYNASPYGHEEAKFILDNPVPKAKLGELKCFIVESTVTGDIICTFCLQAHYAEGKIYIEICHLAKEFSFGSLLNYIGYRHIGMIVFERFAVPMALAFKKALHADGVLGFVPKKRKLIKLFETTYFKALPIKESKAFKSKLEIHTNSNVFWLT